MLLENLPKCYDSWASLVIHLSLQQAVRMLQVHATTCHLYAVLVPAWRSSSCVLQFGTLGLLSHMPARKLPQVKKVAKKVWALLPSLEGSSTTNRSGYVVLCGCDLTATIHLAYSFVGFSQPKPTSKQCFSLTTNQYQLAQTSPETNQRTGRLCQIPSKIV